MYSLSFKELIALTIFASYFLTILFLFRVISTNGAIIWRRKTARQYVFTLLMIASFAHTWYYMLAYLYWSFTSYLEATSGSRELPILRQTTSWLMNTGLFEEAWAIVSSQPLPWWLSEPICLFTVGAWTIFVATNGRKYGVKHLWAYMLLGQLVAISVAANLFFLALVTVSPPNRAKKTASATLVPPILWLSVVISLVTIGISPHTSDQTFLPNLLIMHALIVLPLLPRGYHLASKFSIRTKTLYMLAALFGVVLRLLSTQRAFASLPSDVRSLTEFLFTTWRLLHANPAQSSIGWDVIWTTISFLVWTILSDSSRVTRTGPSAPVMVAITSLSLSVGVSAPLALGGQVDDSETELAQVKA